MNPPILYEDGHLLVVNKPSGVNTHKPDRFAPDGIHEWLAKRQAAAGEPACSILHRLDKDTSGVMIFGKSRRANQSLAGQFETHQVEKHYLLLTTARPTRAKFRAHSGLAETEFEWISKHGRYEVLSARPITGKTHQIRRHAAEKEFPIVGDIEYGGEPAPRLMLHAHTLRFRHPESEQTVAFEAPVPAAFEQPDALVAAREYRELLFGQETVSAVVDADWRSASAGRGDGPPTNMFRLISGPADGFPEVVVDWYARHLHVQWQRDVPEPAAREFYDRLRILCDPLAIYGQSATRRQRTVPRPVYQRDNGGAGAATPSAIEVCENGLIYRVGFGAGLGSGIFADQRENRWRLRRMNLAGKSVLNCFAYTCAFSVAAAGAGATVTSVDLSRNYLAWGRQNFLANALDPAVHEFLFGDVFDWLARFARRGRSWDVVILDPPTFSTTKKGRAFRAERDYLDLAALAMALVKPGGHLFCSTNQRTLAAEQFEKILETAAGGCRRVIDSLDYETLPFDFRVPAGERPYLKAFWATLR